MAETISVSTAVMHQICEATGKRQLDQLKLGAECVGITPGNLDGVTSVTDVFNCLKNNKSTSNEAIPILYELLTKANVSQSKVKPLLASCNQQHKTCKQRRDLQFALLAIDICNGIEAESLKSFQCFFIDATDISHDKHPTIEKLLQFLVRSRVVWLEKLEKLEYALEQMSKRDVLEKVEVFKKVRSFQQQESRELRRNPELPSDAPVSDDTGLISFRPDFMSPLCDNGNSVQHGPPSSPSVKGGNTDPGKDSQSASSSADLKFSSDLDREGLIVWLEQQGISGDDLQVFRDQKIDGDTFLTIPADQNKLVKVLGSPKLTLGAKNRLVKLITEARKVSEKVPETGPPTRGSDTEPFHQPGHPYTNGTRSSDNNDLEQVLETGTHTKKMLIVFADGKKSDLDKLSHQQILDLVDNNTILGGDNLTDVIDCLQTASANWYQICTNLYITKNKIDSLKHSNNRDKVSLIEALSDWLKLNYNYQKHGKPTWRQVARSVCNIDSALFLDISKKHLKKGVSTREE